MDGWTGMRSADADSGGGGGGVGGACLLEPRRVLSKATLWYPRTVR